MFLLDVHLEDLKKSHAKEKTAGTGTGTGTGTSVGKSTDSGKGSDSKPCKDASSVDLVADLQGYETDFSASTVEEDNDSDNDSIDSYLQDMGLDA